MLTKEQIAQRISREVKDRYYVNLGIGIPTLVANYVPENLNVEFQSENGVLGMGPFPYEGDEDADIINAGKQTITILEGGSFFDSAFSFGMIRSKKVDLTILGAMEVSENGDIANWKIPGKMVKGMGGAMDLVASAENIIVAMQHCSKDGQSKLLKECSLPITGIKCVKKIVTDLVDYYGWQELGQLIRIKCFIDTPSINSSLRFLRKTPWARKKVEDLYLDSFY